MSVAVASPAHQLHREIEAARVLLANYRDILGDDEVAKADAVEGETSLLEALRPAVVRIAECEAMCAGIDAMAAKLSKRKQRLEEQAETLRTLLVVAMGEAQKKRFECDIATLTLKPTPRTVVVLDEPSIPSRFFKRAEPKLDKRALLAALKEADEAGEVIPGAALSNGGQTIQITGS